MTSPLCVNVGDILQKKYFKNKVGEKKNSVLL